MMDIIFLYQMIFIVFVSLSLGSFAGMLVYRIPNDKKILSLSERSVCTKCNHELSSWHNIPIISYLILKGRCAFCNVKISPHYFIVELVTVVCLTFTFFYFQSGYFNCQLSLYPNVNMVLSTSIYHTISMMVFVYFIVILGAIDIMTGYLPNKLTYTGMAIGLLFSYIDPSITLQDSLIGIVAGYSSLWIIAKSFLLIRGIDGMGHGDFKMLAMIGAFLGWQSLVFIPLIASLVCLFVVFVFLIKKNGNNKNTEFTFGQYLALASFVLIFINSNVVFYIASSI